MTITYKNTQIFYSDIGKGNVVVLLHGFLENHTMWKDLTPDLAQTHRVIAIDLLGHGQSESLGYIHTMEMMADSVAQVLNTLHIDVVTFVGHSMGGYVALAYAEKHPFNVNGICLLNSTPASDSAERKLNRDRAIKAVKHNSKTFVSMAIGNLFAVNNRERLQAEIQTVKETALKTPLQGVVATLEGMKIREDRTAFFKQATFNKMLIIGTKDPVLNRDTVLNCVENTDVEVVEFPDGHMSHIENKHELTHSILRFIE